MNSIVIDGKIYDEKSLQKKGLNIVFRSGDNNTIKIDSPYWFDNLNITVTGKNNSIILQAGSAIKNTYIGLNMQMDNIRVQIGKNFRCKGANISASGDYNEIIIGDNCEFDSEIYLATQDGHTIYDIESREVMNNAERIVIGDDVYLGYKAMVMKNVTLGNHITVMPCSVVSKSFSEDNLQIAGCPAVVIRTNVARDGILTSEYKKRKCDE